MPKLEDIILTSRIFALLKGEPKTGKDIAAHSFAALGPLYSFDLDARIESVAYYYTKVVPRPDIIRNITYDRFTSFFAIYNRLQALKQNCPFKSIVFSSLTSLARTSMNTMLETRDPPKPGKVDTKTRGGIKLSELEDFGGEANAIAMSLDALLAISIHFNVNVFLTAHIISPDAGAYRPMRTLLTGGKKIAAEIPKNFNEAWNFYVESEGGIELGANIDRRFVCFTRPVGNDWGATALDVPDRVEYTAGKTSGIFYEELFKNVRSANKVIPAETNPPEVGESYQSAPYVQL